MGNDSFHKTELQRHLEKLHIFGFDARNETGWTSQAIVREGKYIADLYAAVAMQQLDS